MLQTLPQLRTLDGRNIFGEPVSGSDMNSSRLQCFEGLLDNLVSSESPLNLSEEEVRHGSPPNSRTPSDYSVDGRGKDSGLCLWQVVDSVPLVTPPLGDMPPLDQFASVPADTGLASVSACPSSQPETVNHEDDFQNEMKLQKLDDQFLQLLNEVTISCVSKQCVRESSYTAGF